MKSANILLCVLTTFFTFSCDLRDNKKVTNENSFILKEMFKHKDCLNTKNILYKDSTEAMKDILTPKKTFYDNINGLKIEEFAWSSGCCKTNIFFVIKTNEEVYFLPFCDESQLVIKKKYISKIVENTLFEKALNDILSRCIFKDKNLFVKNILALLFTKPRITSSANLRQEDRIIINYLDKNINRYSYYPPVNGYNSMWEVKSIDNNVDINIINYKNYKCFCY